MTDLDKLIAAVEAGTLCGDHLGAVFSANNILDWHNNNLAYRAYDGSLDAALRLHEALLPGWYYTVHRTAVRLDTPAHDISDITEFSDNPARAWLLAILRALAATP